MSEELSRTDGDTESETGERSTAANGTNGDTEDATLSEMAAATSASTGTSIVSDDDEEGVLEGNVLLKTLKDEFELFKQRREESKVSRRQKSVPNVIALDQYLQRGGKKIKKAKKTVYSYVTVNFIDPTTTATSTTATTPKISGSSKALESSSTSAPPPPTQMTSPNKFASFMMGSKTQNEPTVNLSLDLYDKLHRIFVRDYDSVLHGVPYEHLRSGAPGTIEKLPVSTILTRSHGSATSNSGDASVPWGGTSGSVAAPVSDPAEWHHGPYCHVYIAACESMEHYRTKVRPAIQAFVSQIEGASGVSRTGSGHGSKLPSGSASNNYSAHYVIVYVPVRARGVAGANGGSSSPPRDPSENRGFGHRLAAARRRVESAAAQVREQGGSLQSSIHSSTTTTASTNFDGMLDHDTNDPAAAPPPGPIAHSSKAERELFKKFNSDFPTGRTCIISTLMDSDSDAATNASPLKNQEWNTFLRMLGSAIVSGWRDRCRRYDDELRRLDAARAIASRPVNKLSKQPSMRFDLSHFFLVKESLAFTYEQMQLPEEALLQYEEMRAFLPSGEGPDRQLNDDKKLKKKASSKRLIAEFDDVALRMAIAGDAVGFRRRLRSATDLFVIEQLVLQYLFAREVSLFLQEGLPEKVMTRSLSFVKTMYRMKVLGSGVVEEKGVADKRSLEERKLEAETWAIDFCWDVKRATENFFTEIDLLGEETMDELSFSRMDDEKSTDASFSVHRQIDPEVEAMERRVANRMGHLLEFARGLFLRLGDSQLEGPNTVRLLTQSLPADMKEAWKPWQVNKSEASRSTSGRKKSLDDAVAMENSAPDDTDLAESSARLLDGAFESAQAYEEKYMELSKSIIALFRNSSKPRLASRLQAETAELYIRNGDTAHAAKALLPITNVCAVNRWDRCHFWRLFRLACCQRQSGKVASYLNTLTQCFGPHLKPVAPVEAALKLQDDFEAVVSVPRVSGYRLGIASFIETELEVVESSGGRSSMLLNFVRKKFIKNLCSVGEAVVVRLKVGSYLPRKVELGALKIMLVSLSAYERKFNQKLPIAEEDAAEILHQELPVSVEPGVNEFEFTWNPLSTGLFILSTVQLQLREACFFYDSVMLRRPLIGIDVQPSKPTQSLELNPLFLIPGQIQEVRITFNPGSDLVEDGTLELNCSEGLEVIPPGENPKTAQWSSTCEIPLPECKSGKPVVIVTTVKSSPMPAVQIDADAPLSAEDSIQTMQAKVTTSYRHELCKTTKSDKEQLKSFMTTVLEAMVTTLDKPALTVDSCQTIEFGDNQVMVNINLHCNTPVPFSIKEWKPKMPRMKVARDGDMNKDLFGHPTNEGEQLAFGFKCSHVDGGSDSEEKPVLLIVLQDEFGKTFNQVVSLDFDSLYDRMRKDEEYSGASNTVASKLTVSKSEGLVGSPVELTYEVDASSLKKPKNYSDKHIVLLYELCSEDTDWITGGRVQGSYSLENGKRFKLDFVGIPVFAGVLKAFPKLRLSYKTGQEDLPPIIVHPKNPDSFKSVTFKNHMALACPQGLEV